ncbi:MAG: nicotinate phosphoribosyltransferase, partial [Anaerolineales bacterium]
VIWQIITQITEEAPRYGVDADRLIRRLVYGVGTRLITSWGEPALGGVYKLVAVYDENQWKPAIKISESIEKTPNPGNKKVWRIYDQRWKATADLITLSDEDPRQKTSLTLRHPTDHTKYRSLRRDEISEIEPLLETILEEGKLVYT